MTQFDFVKNRKIFYIISLCLFAVILVSFFINGIVLDVTFKGGTRMLFELQQDIDPNDAGALVEQSLSGKKVNASITKTYAGGAEQNTTMLRLDVAGDEPLTAEEEQKVREVLKANYPVNLESKLNQQSSINPSFGREMLEKGLTAVLISTVLILFYVAWRFSIMSGMSAAVCSVIALIHDCIMMVGTFIIFKLPFNDIFIASILTIIGYSINDTIVLYDRIRENSSIMKKADHATIVNVSTWQTLSRSINTAVTTLISVLILYIFAAANNIGSLKDFGLSLVVGVITGCYSSVFIAAPLWYGWREKRLKTKLAAKA